jgi:hypothetical protein
METIFLFIIYLYYLFIYAWPLHFSACCEVYIEIKAKTRVILRRRRKAHTGHVTVFVDCKMRVKPVVEHS